MRQQLHSSRSMPASNPSAFPSRPELETSDLLAEQCVVRTQPVDSLPCLRKFPACSCELLSDEAYFIIIAIALAKFDYCVLFGLIGGTMPLRNLPVTRFPFLANLIQCVRIAVYCRFGPLHARFRHFRRDVGQGRAALACEKSFSSFHHWPRFRYRWRHLQPPFQRPV